MLRGFVAALFALLATSVSAQTLAILDSFEKIDYTDGTHWVTSASIKVSKGEPIGYVIRLKNDDDMPTYPEFTRAYRLVAVPIDTPSYTGGTTGNFYDAMVPLNATSLVGAEYVYAEYEAPSVVGVYDVDFVQSGDTVTVHVEVIDNTLAQSGKRLYVGVTNSYIWRGHHGTYAAPAESLGPLYSAQAVAHRMTPFGSEVSNPSIQNGRLNYATPAGVTFNTHVLANVPNYFMMPPIGSASPSTTYMAAAEAAVVADGQTGVWWYTWDEPSAGNKTTVQNLITNMNTFSPSIKSMVTTGKYLGLSPEPDIYCPVLELFDDAPYVGESAYAGQDLWLYTSCMEHGCGTPRYSTGAKAATKVSGTATGRPGLVIDHPVSYIYAFVLLPMHYTSLKNLLYYNAVEGYRLYDTSITGTPQIDVWDDQFNFGGNGDGTLFYPLRPADGWGAASHGPAVSMRMKKIRDAMYLLDYVTQVGPSIVDDCGGTALITNTETWVNDPDDWETFRTCLVNAVDGAAPPQPPVITTTEIPDGSVGAAYSTTIVCTDGVEPYVFTVQTGSLCSNLSLNAGSGAITGTPDTVQTCSFTIRCTDDNLNFDDQAFSQDITASAPVITGSASGGSTTAVIGFGYAGLPSEVPCEARVFDASSLVDTGTSTSGRSRRSVVVAGLAEATTYNVEFECETPSSDTPIAFTTYSETMAAQSLTFSIGPPPSILSAATHAELMCSYTPDMESVSVAGCGACGIGCSLGLSRNPGVSYCRVRRTTSNCTVLATGTVQPIPIP